MHTAVGATWLGAMFYSLFVVQPRAESFLADDRRMEEFAATLAAGARWKVLAVAAVLAVTGAGLFLVDVDVDGAPGGWLAVVAVKACLLLVALVVFVDVSWRLWPRRVLASGRELPHLRRRFRIDALVLTALVGTNLVLGVVAESLR